MNKNNSNINFISMLIQRPHAISLIKGSGDYPQIKGSIRFYQTKKGVLVATEVSGLPTSSDKCKNSVYALHIHSGSSCSGNENDPFLDALTHYNPYNCPHPQHAGDMPPLFANNGSAFSAFLTDRFSVSEIIGKTVIIHSSPDDFTSQPAGNSGTKIACGVISQIRR